MTAVPPTGALSTPAAAWHTIDWYTVHRTVRRLQARLVKAVQVGRWGKVRALQHLLTHSFSGKAIAVKRVTSNDGKRTPGVDGVIWDTPEKKACAILKLRQRGYQAQPLRRIYIPKNGSTNRFRPLSIPTMHDRAMQALYLLASIPLRKRRAIRTPMASAPSDPQRMRLGNASRCCLISTPRHGFWRATYAPVSTESAMNGYWLISRWIESCCANG